MQAYNDRADGSRVWTKEREEKHELGAIKQYIYIYY